MKQIFNNKNRSVFSNNVESSLNINLSTKTRLLSTDNIEHNFSLNDQYNKERDECEKYRFILAINPVCSNVLFNTKTEIVINEGSENIKTICDCSEGYKKKKDIAPNARNTTSAITYLQAIRDTEYSHPELGNFTYHCGYDIFNNHMLRSEGFIHVNNGDKSDTYNTIFDYIRNSEGKIVQQDINVTYHNKKKTDMHLYRFDNLISMKRAFYEHCKERDGWWGFYNPSFINIANDNKTNKNIMTNNLLSYKKPCEFIDLYPDRSLFSFIPKYNKYRNRLEKNWDYCLTYPYKNDYDLVNTIMAPDKDNHNGSIRVDFIKKYNGGGAEVLECHSYSKHNLTVGSTFNLYDYDKNNNTLQRYGKTINVDNISSDRIFNVKVTEILPIYNAIKNEKDDNGHFYFKRVNGTEECKYYFRKFKKIKNIDGTELKSDINKIAFSKNIYGDDMAQIIFTDDIDVSGLLDNNNAPISEIYLTIIKRNAGHKIWYKEGDNADSSLSSSTIEYSHCFGEVTSGLDFSGIKNEPFDYNVRKLHNLNYTNNSSKAVENTFAMWGDTVVQKPRTIEDGIYEIATALNTNKILDISNGSTSNGANVQIWQRSNVKRYD